MREILQDIVKHTGGLGFIDMVKVTGSSDETLVEAMDNDKTVIVKGKLLTPLEQFEGEFGMSNLGLLKGLTDFANFKTDKATISVVRRQRGAVEVPEEIAFSDAEGQSASYRLMSSELVPAQHKFLGTNWDVTIAPTKSKIQEFSSLAGLYANFENYFMAKTNGDELRFYIGDEQGASHKAFVIFEKPVKGSLSTGIHWPISQVLSILKLGAEGSTTMSFSIRGALMISMKSEFAEWSFILPAKKK